MIQKQHVLQSYSAHHDTFDTHWQDLSGNANVHLGRKRASQPESNSFVYKSKDDSLIHSFYSFKKKCVFFLAFSLQVSPV